MSPVFVTLKDGDFRASEKGDAASLCRSIEQGGLIGFGYGNRFGHYFDSSEVVEVADITDEQFEKLQRDGKVPSSFGKRFVREENR